MLHGAWLARPVGKGAAAARLKQVKPPFPGGRGWCGHCGITLPPAASTKYPARIIMTIPSTVRSRISS